MARRIITAREQVQMLSPWRLASGFDPMKVTQKLHTEFHDWFHNLPADRIHEIKNIEMHPFMDHHEDNPVSHWPTVERFLKDKYPAAHRGFMTGHEDASMWLDNPNNEYEDPMLEGDDEFGSLPPPEPYSSADHEKLGYDPQEIAAGMVLLHNRAHSGRQDSYLNTDKARLVDIFNKRQQMQRTYEQRTSMWRRLGMAYWMHHGQDTIHHLPAAEVLSYRQYDPMDPHQDFFPYDKGYPTIDAPSMDPESGWALDAHGRAKTGDENMTADQLRNNLREHAIHTPVEIVTDGQRAIMTDGTHRATIAHEVGHSRIPAYVKYLHPADYDFIAEQSPIGSVGRPHPSAGPAVRSLLAPVKTAANDLDDILDLLGRPGRADYTRPSPREENDPIPGVPKGWEKYVTHLQGQPDLSDTAHLHLPVEVLDHYKEYDREPGTDQAKALAHMIKADGGVRSPVHISTDGTHALMHEGNNRLAVAKQLGITHLPVNVTLEPPGQVVRNSGTPVPLERHLGGWLDANGHTLKSFWKGG